MGVRRESNGDIAIKFRDEEERGKGFSQITSQYGDLQMIDEEREGQPYLVGFSDAGKIGRDQEIRTAAEYDSTAEPHR